MSDAKYGNWKIKGEEINIDELALAKMLYGALKESLKDSDLYYRGISPDYYYLTDKGKDTLIAFIEQMAPLILKADEDHIRKRAKTMTFDKLSEDAEQSL